MVYIWYRTMYSISLLPRPQCSHLLPRLCCLRHHSRFVTFCTPSWLKFSVAGELVSKAATLGFVVLPTMVWNQLFETSHRLLRQYPTTSRFQQLHNRNFARAHSLWRAKRRVCLMRSKRSQAVYQLDRKSVFLLAFKCSCWAPGRQSLIRGLFL